MTTQPLVHTWFSKWESGDFENLPLAEDFKHTSPYGLVDGKEAYLDLVRSNKEAFLGNTFELKDELYNGSKAVVRYTMTTKSGTMEISEWFQCEDGLIKEIHSYYNIPT